MKRHLLFLCTANIDRSPVAEALFKNNKNYEAISAGISDMARNKVTKEMISWADIIFVMDERNDQHKSQLVKNFPEAWDKEIVLLGIPNDFTRNDPELLRLLKLRLGGWL